MVFDKKKIFYASAAFLVSLFLLFSGQQLFNRFVTFNPLNQAFSQKEYVKQVSIKKESGTINLEICLEDIDDFAEVYYDIQETASEILKGKPFKVEITNKPSDLLEDIYDDRVQYVIFEGIKTGKFTEMRAALDEIETEFKIDIAVFLDNENLYLKIKSDQDLLYKIIRMQ